MFKDKMRDSMMGKMSSEDKKEMMEKMMEHFFSGMKEEEKHEFMKEMMPKMMHHMRGHRGAMIGMMGCGPGKKGEKGFSPWEMCREMMSSMRQSSRIATLATPEVQGLFEDWVEQIEEEILDYIKNKDTIDSQQIAKHFKISKDSAYYFLTRLAQKGKIKLNVKKDKI